MVAWWKGQEDPPGKFRVCENRHTVFLFPIVRLRTHFYARAKPTDGVPKHGDVDLDAVSLTGYIFMDSDVLYIVRNVAASQSVQIAKEDVWNRHCAAPEA